MSDASATRPKFASSGVDMKIEESNHHETNDIRCDILT